MGRQNGLMTAHWAVTGDVGKSPFCASNVQALALILRGNCSARPQFALTRATFLSMHWEGFPSGLKETLSLFHRVWICSDSFENSAFAVRTPLNDFVCCVCCLIAVAACSETAGEMPLEFVLPGGADPSMPGELLLVVRFFWKSELKVKSVLKLVTRKIKFLPYLGIFYHSAEEKCEFSALCCYTDQIRICLHGNSSLHPSYLWAGHKSFYVRTEEHTSCQTKDPATPLLWFSMVLIRNYDNFPRLLTFAQNRIPIPASVMWSGVPQKLSVVLLKYIRSEINLKNQLEMSSYDLEAWAPTALGRHLVNVASQI